MERKVAGRKVQCFALICEHVGGRGWRCRGPKARAEDVEEEGCEDTEASEAVQGTLLADKPAQVPSCSQQADR